MSIVVLAEANELSIVTRCCSVGKGSDELTLQRESDDATRCFVTTSVCP